MKKNVLVLLVALATSVTMFAQSDEGFSKGDVLVSGAFSFNSNKNDSSGNYKSSNFKIQPRVGYFVSDNIAIGGTLGYETTNITETEGDTELSSNTFSIGGFGRYYFTPADKFSLFGDLSLAYVSREIDSLPKINGFGAGLGLGMNYFVSSNWALEAGLGLLSFSSAKFDGASDSSTNFNLGLNLTQISIGVNYKF